MSHCIGCLMLLMLIVFSVFYNCINNKRKQVKNFNLLMKRFFKNWTPFSSHFLHNNNIHQHQVTRESFQRFIAHNCVPPLVLTCDTWGMHAMKETLSKARSHAVSKGISFVIIPLAIMRFPDLTFNMDTIKYLVFVLAHPLHTVVLFLPKI